MIIRDKTGAEKLFGIKSSASKSVFKDILECISKILQRRKKLLESLTLHLSKML